MDHFNVLLNFLKMNGHAIFVWPAYSLVIVFLVFNILLGRFKLQRLKAKLRSNYANSS